MKGNPNHRLCCVQYGFLDFQKNERGDPNSCGFESRANWADNEKAGHHLAKGVLGGYVQPVADAVAEALCSVGLVPINRGSASPYDRLRDCRVRSWPDLLDEIERAEDSRQATLSDLEHTSHGV